MRNLRIEWQDVGGLSVAINEHHRFGTDAVLLENFALSRPASRICDIGSGCGIIPFLICKRKKNLEIFAVEIQNDAAKLIEASAEKNNLNNIKVICGDVRDRELVSRNIENTSLDLVICNPPYYKENSGAKSPKEERAKAREEGSLSIYDAAQAANKMLKFGGRFCICQKSERLCDCFDAMRKNSIEPKRMRMIYSSISQKPWLVLIEGKKGAKPFLEVMPPLVIDSDEGQREIKSIYTVMGCE